LVWLQGRQPEKQYLNPINSDVKKNVSTWQSTGLLLTFLDASASLKGLGLAGIRSLQRADLTREVSFESQVTQRAGARAGFSIASVRGVRQTSSKQTLRGDTPAVGEKGNYIGKS